MLLENVYEPRFKNTTMYTPDEGTDMTPLPIMHSCEGVIPIH